MILFDIGIKTGTMSGKNKFLQHVAYPHIESFNYVLERGLKDCCKDIDPVWTKTSSPVKISIADVKISPLSWPMDTRKHKRIIYPSEARMRKTTYYAEFKIDLQFDIDSETFFSERTFFVPLMLKSDLCLLKGLTDHELIACKEDVNDPGGYFIVNGAERLIRQFVVPRRNFPIALRDSKFRNLKNCYSDYAILVRSVKENHTNKNIFLHYVEDGSVVIHLFFKKKVFYLPFMLVMKALKDDSDNAIVDQVLEFRQRDPFLKQALVSMLRDLYEFDPDKPDVFNNVRSQKDTKNVIGNLFKPIINAPYNPTDVTDYFFRKSLLIHLNSDAEKFTFLSYSLAKLYSLVNNEFKPEDLDNPIYQEVLTTGQIYLIMIKYGAEFYLNSVKNSLGRAVNKGKTLNLTTVKSCSNKALSLTPEIKKMIATGNVPSNEHGLASNTGFTVVLKRTNVFDTASQFLSINKFTMKFYATNMRKFYPEAWGFLCPAQTPEGENSGLYNYLSSECQVVALNTTRIKPEVIYRLGVHDIHDPLACSNSSKCFIFMDGDMFAWIELKRVYPFLKRIKHIRNLGLFSVPHSTEVVHIPVLEHQIMYPGIYIFSTPCRLVRRVLRRELEAVIGIFEQLSDNEFREIDVTSFLSVAAASIPFMENNPATRNIFSCVKSRQALSFPFQNSRFRADTKSAALIYPQTPLVYTKIWDDYNLDEYPTGTNVIIAVISYSGFDMEDAVTINKASVERGLMQDVVHKTVIFNFKDLAEELNCNISDLCFGLDPNDAFISYYLDPYGLPHVGDVLKPDDAILSFFSKTSRKYRIKKFKEQKKAYIESVRFLLKPSIPKEKNLPEEFKKIAITYSMKRVPSLGDKFSNRHSQKGVCGYMMPATDFPFSASGITPDILFNPHGLPSRMSIGMMLEIMASKSSLLIGQRCLVQPFKYCQEENASFNQRNLSDVESGKNDKFAADDYGKLLKDAGFDYFGTEKFYSGTSGEELEANIFCGSVYYFRLHHVVEEKAQVESVNQIIDPATRQPINMHSGALRFGEMERDSILSHGALEVTMDRLLHNSDKCSALICSRCKLMMNPLLLNYSIDQQKSEEVVLRELKEKFNVCKMCGSSENHLIQIPHVFHCLISELSAVNIKIKFSVE